ncbi:MAG: HAD family hydrolase [candidate division NC10 bacterium]
MPYAAILFDLFDTLVRFDRERMPEIQVNGKTVRSSAGALHALLRVHAPEIGLEQCYEALIASWREAERLRAIDHREVPAPVRFAHFFRRLGLDEATLPPGLTQALIDAHRGALGRAADFPAHHGPLLRSLAARYRLAVVSNFDYTPTALDILERAGVTGLFGAIVVSDEIGWRKPRREIFDAALGRLGVRPEEALFVGDRADMDVLGARRIGMDAAWVNPGREALPAGIDPPQFEIRDLGELAEILEL